MEVYTKDMMTFYPFYLPSDASMDCEYNDYNY